MDFEKERFPSPEDVLYMSPFVLGRIILRWLWDEHQSGSGNRLKNINNFFSALKTEWSKRGHNVNSNHPAENHVIQAWAFLTNELYLIPDPTNGSNGWMRIGPRAEELLKSDSKLEFLPNKLLDVDHLDSELRDKAATPFMTGDLDQAVFAAYRLVEGRLRKKSGLKEFDGERLISRSLGDSGILYNPEHSSGQKQALHKLFLGAYGYFRNPPAHKGVDYGSAREVADIIRFANVLLGEVSRLKKTRKKAKKSTC